MKDYRKSFLFYFNSPRHIFCSLSLSAEQRDEIKINCNCETMNIYVCGIYRNMYMNIYIIFTLTYNVFILVRFGWYEIFGTKRYIIFNDKNYFSEGGRTITTE